MGAPRLTQAKIERALAAFKAEVGPIAAVMVMPDGSIRVEGPVDRPAEPQHDNRKPKPWT
ncbi:hypothetical protein [Pararhodobacter sp. CCB-MM2]|uniref:hypothetical protein n=1 Tax=Pararhodobacter sp. CCB-MM2 TaxID=1786003 RepID=UPI00082D5359|nr:hypothetical protein [Pararhodobacter sp. CCB-MM2]